MYVGSEGPLTARLAIVAEKPGREEARLGRPLVGPTGQEVDRLLKSVGIPRTSVYLTNAVKTFDSFDNPTNEDIIREQRSLYRELSRLTNLNCIIAMGNVALSALSNFHYDSITKYRGSILHAFTRHKMVPTFHPSYYIRGNWQMKPVVRFDIARALEESYTPKRHLPRRTYYIQPSYTDVLAWEQELMGSERLAFDIELMRGRVISCISFANRPDVAYCIPFCTNTRQNYWSSKEEAQIWRIVQNLLLQEHTTYITQNGLFDCWHLLCHGIRAPYMSKGLDTMYMHRLRAPDLPHDLGFLVSIYTREPYYKDESGNWSSDIPVADDQFWTYNCKDSACTFEVADELEKDLREQQQLTYYRTEMQRQWDLLLRMREVGIHVDTDKLQAVRTQLRTEIDRCNEALTNLLGWIPNTKSHIDMQKLFQFLNIRPSQTPTGRVKIDEEHLRIYANQVPAARPVLLKIVELNQQRTLQSGFTNMSLSPRHYYHASYDLSHTKTGRLSSKGAEEGGPQLQNIPQSMRSVFIPDDPTRDEFTGADLKQAEAMVVAWDAEDHFFIEAFQSGLDVHRIVACMIFRNWPPVELPPAHLMASITVVCPRCAAQGEQKCNHSERYIAKQSKHAFAYKMGIRRFTALRREEGIFMDEREARRIQDVCTTTAVRRWQERIYQELKRSPWLKTPLNRRREFYGLLDDDMHRAALSWIAQATVGEITNQAMIELHEQYRALSHHIRIVTQTHDSLLTSHPVEYRAAVVALLQQAFNRPMSIHGRTLTIPLEIEHGNSWGTLKEVK